MEVHIVIDVGEEHDFTINLVFKTTNHEAEYNVLFFGHVIAKSMCAKEVKV